MKSTSPKAMAQTITHLTGPSKENLCQIRTPLKLIQVPSFTGTDISTWTLNLGCTILLHLAVSRSNSKGVPTTLAIAIRLFRSIEGRFGKDNQILASCTGEVEILNDGCQSSTKSNCPPMIQYPIASALALSSRQENLIRNTLSPISMTSIPLRWRG